MSSQVKAMETADTVRAAVVALNHALREAAALRLKVEIDTLPMQTVNGTYAQFSVDIWEPT
jgi:hypothetical protein